VSIPYLGPPTRIIVGDNLPPTRIVVHATVSPTKRGGARDTAAYFRSEAPGGSAHLAVDPFETVRSAHDNVICWGAPPNPNSLHIEFCDPQAGNPDRWHDPDHQQMLRRGAVDVAAWCTHYKLPIVRTGPAALLKGAHGIAGHVDVSQAWHQSDHSDPGPDFPWAQFLGMVVAAAHPKTPKSPAPKPKPRTFADGGDMFQPFMIQVKGDAAIYLVTLAGTRHVKNATEMKVLVSGGVPATPHTVSAKELADLLEVE
jgi:N-acetylmuramoyl-L-alanine amidase